jgi:predicted branched-subunit amino acid permease
MRNFGIGLGIGLLGAILWVISSVVGGIGEGLGGERLIVLRILMYIGFIVMFVGPLVWWIVLPLVNIIRRRR